MTQVERLGALGGEHVAGVRRALASAAVANGDARHVGVDVEKSLSPSPFRPHESKAERRVPRDDGPHGPEKRSSVECRRQAIEPLHRPGPRTLMEKQPQQPALAAQQRHFVGVRERTRRRAGHFAGVLSGDFNTDLTVDLSDDCMTDRIIDFMADAPFLLAMTRFTISSNFLSPRFCSDCTLNTMSFFFAISLPSPSGDAPTPWQPWHG